MSRKLRLPDQLFIPFGRPKWKIKDINIVKVAPDGTYMESDVPFAYIDKREERPLQIADFWDVVPDSFLNKFTKISPYFDKDDDGDISQKAITEFDNRCRLINDYLKNDCEADTSCEKKFLDIYFDYWFRYAFESSEPSIQYVSTRIRPLLPLPQAHLYLNDSREGQMYIMQKVDFAFWTGQKLIAVEIDGDRKLLPDVVRRDRRYRDSGIEVVHILNSEVEELGNSVMNLLPEELRETDFLRQLPPRNPYIDSFDDDAEYI
jgi:hypothetical protein